MQILRGGQHLRVHGGNIPQRQYVRLPWTLPRTEQGRYASFRIDQALDHPKASRLVLQQMIASLEEVIGQLFIFEAGSRINTNRYTCLISQFREKQALAKRALEHSDKNNTPEVFV